MTDPEGATPRVHNKNRSTPNYDRDFNTSDIIVEADEGEKRMNASRNDHRPNRLFEINHAIKSLCSTPPGYVHSELDEDAIMNLECLDMVVREGLCLYPEIPVMIIRQCSENTNILGQSIPGGTPLVVPTWHIHRDPQIWPEAERFLPDRFSTGLRECSPSFYYPFGLGSRLCVAHRLGMVMLKKTLYNVLKRYNLTLDESVSDPLPVVLHNFVLNLAATMKIRLEPKI